MAERIPTEEVERLLDEATPGPWTTASDRPRYIDTGHTVQIDEADWGQPEEGQYGADSYSVGLLADDRAWRYGDVRLIAAGPDLAADLLDARREKERLAELVGKHDPTGADHMEEMWVHAQRADAAEAEIERLREALEVIHGTAAAAFKTGGTFGTIVGIESVARFALSGEET